MEIRFDKIRKRFELVDLTVHELEKMLDDRFEEGVLHALEALLDSIEGGSSPRLWFFGKAEDLAEEILARLKEGAF